MYISISVSYIYIYRVFHWSWRLPIQLDRLIIEIQGPPPLQVPSVHCPQHWNHRTTLLFTLLLGTQTQVLTDWAISPAPCSCNTCIVVFQNRWSFFSLSLFVSIVFIWIHVQVLSCPSLRMLSSDPSVNAVMIAPCLFPISLCCRFLTSFHCGRTKHFAHF